MLGAISMVLGYFTISIGNFLKIGFTFLPNQTAFYLFGPVAGGIFGGAMDILNYFIKPTGPFFFGFTFDAILSGVIFGAFLYKKPLSIKRIFIVSAVEMIIVNLILHTYWLSILQGKAFLALLPLRALKSIIMLPIETILLFTLLKYLESSGIKKIFQ